MGNCSQKGVNDGIKVGGIEVLQRRANGVWKVRVVMGSKELEETMSEEVSIEALIHRLRTAAAIAASVSHHQLTTTEVYPHHHHHRSRSSSRNFDKK